MSENPHFTCSILTTAYLPPVEYFFAIAHSDRVLIEQHEAYQKQSWRSRCRILAAAGPEDLSIPIVKEERRSRPIRDIRIDYSEPWLQHHIRALSAAYNHSAFYDYYADDLIPILESKPAFLFDLNQSLLEKLLSLLDIGTPISLTDSFVKPGSTSFVMPDLIRHLSPRASFPEARSEHPCLRALDTDNTERSTRPAHACPNAPWAEGPVFDGRQRIQPKSKERSLLAEYGREQAYYQVFINQDPSSVMPGSSRHAGPDPASQFVPNLSIIDLLSAEGPDAGSFLL